MKALKQRIKALALALETMPQRRLKLLPLVVDEHTTDAEIERLRRGGRAVFRSGDPALYDEFV